MPYYGDSGPTLADLLNEFEVKSYSGSYTISTAMHRMMEAALDMDKASGKLKPLEDALKKIPAGSPVFDGHRLMGFTVDEVSADATDVTVFYGGSAYHRYGSWPGLTEVPPSPPKPDPPLKVRNDGRLKRKREPEPFYVSKTKRKRR